MGKNKFKRAPVVPEGPANEAPGDDFVDQFDLNDFIEEVDPAEFGLGPVKTRKRKLSKEPAKPKKKAKKASDADSAAKDVTKQVVKKAKADVKVADESAVKEVDLDASKAEIKNSEKSKKKPKAKKKKPKAKKESQTPPAESDTSAPTSKKAPANLPVPEDDPETLSLDLSAWDSFYLPPEVVRGLRKMRYTAPTPIQAQTIPEAVVKRRDVLGSAETGSGKTMAFGIPIAIRLLENTEKTGLRALILAPTRELVIQITKELNRLLEFTPLYAVQIVGGLSAQKQERLLKRQPKIVVATPGRYWALVEQNPYLGDLRTLDVFVIDEMDRMVEAGHFAEMEHILERVHGAPNKSLQTLVFSATLSFVHLPARRSGKPVKFTTYEDRIQRLIEIGGLREQHKVIDLNQSSAMPATLEERRMNCSDLLDKDTKLYCLLKKHTGRTIIFANSIDASRRLSNLLKNLDIDPPPELLHAKMQQKARVKHLDRFSKKENSILIATDVAARGLDIQGIDNVIHYQVPRTGENYIHRSGRTARISNTGITIVMVDPQDGLAFQKLKKNLRREDDFDLLEVDSLATYKAAKQRVALATHVESFDRQIGKIAATVNWQQKMSDEAEIPLGELDEESREKVIDLKRLRKSAAKALKASLATPLPTNQARRR